MAVDTPKPRKQIDVGHANTFHDPSIAIAQGDAIFAESFERHLQAKRSFQNTNLWYSWRAVTRALSELGILPTDNADLIVLSSWLEKGMPLPPGHGSTSNGTILDGMGIEAIQNATLAGENVFLQHMYCIMKGTAPTIAPLARQLLPGDGAPFQFLEPQRGMRSPPEKSLRWQVKAIEHHLAHAAHAVYTSTFDECAVMISDGTGESDSLAFYHFRDNTFERLPVEDGPPQLKDSLGLLYGRVTGLCGFNAVEGEEWKTMGLAAYGSSNPDIYDFFRSRIEVKGLNVTIHIGLSAWAELESMVGGFRDPSDENVLRSADLAHNFQKAFEDVTLDVTNNFAKLCPSPNLAYGGGCALNSSLNGKILQATPFERLHVPSAPADDGNSLGVVLYQKHFVRAEPRRSAAASPFLGSLPDMAKLEHVLSLGSIEKYKHFSNEDELCSAVADRLAAGEIIGWMQGRAEFGPRALGNRSIIADPRQPEMKDRINKRVKFREEYRPLAPSILHEFGPEYFENYQPSPYMERTLRFRPEVVGRVPAAVHKDGTGRLQTVTAALNPRFHHLISRFHARTGVPLILNTSLNVMGKPMVHSVEDALTVFFTTGLDALVIGNYLIHR